MLQITSAFIFFTINIYIMENPGQQVLTLDKFNMLSVIGKGSYAKVVLVKKKGEEAGEKTYAMGN